MLRLPNGLSGETQFEQEPAVSLDFNVTADRHIVENAVIVLLAGQIAEAQHWKKLAALYSPLVDTHRHDDDEIAKLKLGFRFSPEKDAAYMAHCTQKTKDIVLRKESQAAIEDISRKLADKLSISRDELDEILARHNLSGANNASASSPSESDTELMQLEQGATCESACKIDPISRGIGVQF